MWSITHETCITNLGDWCKNKQGEESDKFYWVSRPSDYMLTHFQLFSEVSVFHLLLGRGLQTHELYLNH